MMTRRDFLGWASALSVSGALWGEGAFGHASALTESENTDDLTRFVRPAIGTGGHGHTYPGASVPFGMVQLSPDTYNNGWDWCSGYHYSDGSIMGFSHTHLSGTGAADMLDFLLMPGTGPVKTESGSREHPEEGYRSRFSHDDEISVPGYYSVLLSDYKIRAELSATERAGIHKYTFPKSVSSHFILDLAHVISDTPILWSNLQLAGSDTILGGRSTDGWAKGRELYFAMRFSKPFSEVEFVSEGQKTRATHDAVHGKSLKCILHFETHEGEVIYVKTGLSGVSTDGALKNVNAEIPGWNFERVRQDAHNRWRRELARIRIDTPDETRKHIFYTGMYHLMLAPTLFDDVDGKYRGMDGKVHQLPAGAHNYSTFSLWDTYRATHPLYTLILSERVPDFVNCLIRMASESPAGMPVWPLQGKETGCMTGYHSAAVIAEACAKGFKGINYAEAYSQMRKRAMDDDYRGLGWYRRLGYIPCDKEEESVSKTFEYLYDDWAVAHVAKAVGADQDAQILFDRSKSYRNVFDTKEGFTRPKLENGQWAEPFDPKAMGHSKKWRDFTESNAWQTTFAIQHDPKGYIGLFGGNEAFVRKLDALFDQSSELPADAPPDIAGLVGQYAHGNEPSHHIAYLYAYAGAPYKTQERVHGLLETMYRDDPDGMAGNEDCGQMSAWFVLSALGFYSVDPVSGHYVIGTPLFDRVVVEVGNGKKLTIEAKRRTRKDKYIDSITFNGKAYEKLWLDHSDLARGGTLIFAMTSNPSKQFGAVASAIPPSLTA
ncbi:MAG TPA: GH92 family glycosyl hydrolase [Terriglobales bacterium]|nr:GH92 family glycosyl hydrolase [Terriglobales bacterium]